MHSVAAGPAMQVEYSDSLRDRVWDEFLLSVPPGQYSQSSMWAETKAADGWRPWRLMMKGPDGLAGGFQVLCKKTKFGRIGYVAKGPVLAREDAQLALRLMDELNSAARKLGCRAMVVQPPDSDVLCSPIMDQHGYLPNHMVNVIDATLLLRLKPGPAQPDEILNRSNRRNVRQSQKRGLSFVERDLSDLPHFFQLMLATCQRQRQTPNPSTVEALETMWNAFKGGGHARLFFVALAGELVSGQLCIGFGRRFTSWKRGWSGRHGNLCPNDLLTWGMIERAADAGYGEVDFGSLKRSSAKALIAGRSPEEIAMSSRDVFHLGFGGTPILQPPARVFIPNPLVKLMYKLSLRLKRGDAATE